MNIKPCGDAAILIDIQASEATDAGITPLAAVMNIHQQIHAMEIPGIIDIVPAATTVLISLDPAQLTPHNASALLTSLPLTVSKLLIWRRRPR